MTNALSPDELERIGSWAGAIAQELRPEAPVTSTPEGLRLGRKGSLAISTTEGWYDHEAGTGGRDVLSLIRHLRGVTAAEAAAWACDWLDQHPGEGELSTVWLAEAVTEAGERRSAFARQVLDEAVDILGTAAETYLGSRGLEPPYPCCVRWLPDARRGESALVGILTTADGEAVGVQLGYLDPQGRKSTIQPRRQLFLLAKEKAEQGAFRIASSELAEGAAELVICEGLEDALSIAQAGAVKAVLGLPGVGRFSKFDLPASTEVVVFRDGDVADSPAARQLAEAVDRWVLAGVRVRVTTTSEGDDANSILQDKGAEELRRLIAEAEPAELGFDANVVRLARLAPLQYEKERAPAAARHQVRVAFLDAAVKTARSEAEAAAAEQDDEVPYPEPISELAPVLDAALTEMRRYVAGTEPELAAAVLWSLHAHLVHRDKVWLPVSPKLAIQAPDRNCGKSTLLEVVGALTPRPETGSSVTASVVFRLIEARKADPVD